MEVCKICMTALNKDNKSTGAAICKPCKAAINRMRRQIKNGKTPDASYFNNLPKINMASLPAIILGYVSSSNSINVSTNAKRGLTVADAGTMGLSVNKICSSAPQLPDNITLSETGVFDIKPYKYYKNDEYYARQSFIPVGLSPEIILGKITHSDNEADFKFFKNISLLNSIGEIAAYMNEYTERLINLSLVESRKAAYQYNELLISDRLIEYFNQFYSAVIDWADWAGEPEQGDEPDAPRFFALELPLRRYYVKKRILDRMKSIPNPEFMEAYASLVKHNALKVASLPTELSKEQWQHCINICKTAPERLPNPTYNQVIVRESLRNNYSVLKDVQDLVEACMKFCRDKDGNILKKNTTFSDIKENAISRKTSKVSAINIEYEK